MSVKFIERLEKAEKRVRKKKGIVKKLDCWLFLALLRVMNRVKSCKRTDPDTINGNKQG